ncbi:Retrovirus-related Pol polyprotein from transposon TNT 1-94 [Bienertia sinuspersici]
MASKETSKKGIGIDFTSPLYLHPSEGKLVISEKLQGISNYRTWRRSMEIALASKRKLGFVTGQVKRDRDDQRKQELWDTCNNTVLSWLHASVSDSIKKSILYHSSSREVWIQLEKRFSISNGALKYKINKQLYDTKQWGMPISEYYTKLKSYSETVSTQASNTQEKFIHCGRRNHHSDECWWKYGFPKGHPNSREGQRGYRKEGGNLNSKGGRFKHGNKKAAYNVALSEGGGHNLGLTPKLKKSLLLKDVLYVPNFKHNLLSINRLVKRDKCEVVFYSDVCKI